MFKEFSRCSRRGFVLSLLTGGAVILAAAGLMYVSGNAMFLKAGFIFALAGARLAEVIYSRSCPWTKACLESAVLSLAGMVLVVADDLVTSLAA